MATQETAWDTKQTNLYAKYGSDNNYLFHPGVFALPVAIDPADLSAGESPVVCVTAHAPYRERVVTFEAKKKTGPPVIPSPESAGAFVFIGGSLRFAGPGANQTLQSWDWDVAGTYVFVEDVKSSPDDGFVLTSLPFPLETQAENRVIYGIGQPPSGAVSLAGDDAKIGFSQASVINPQSLYWGYTTMTYFPGVLCNAEMINGEAPPLDQ